MSEYESKRALGFAGDESVEIHVAPNAGACFGVVRAIKLGIQATDRSLKAGGTPVFSLGPLIHNPKVVDDLESRGMRPVETAGEAKGTVVLRSHGVRQEIEKELRDRGVKIVDATCPLVKKPQRIAQSLGEKGYFLVLVGDANHPEVKGVLSYFGRPDFLVTYTPSSVDAIPASVKKVGVLAQTTIELKVLNEVVARCRARFSDVTVHNTICDATSIRQEEAVQLAAEADIMVVVGGKNSSNTNKLVKICRDQDTETYLVEEIEEINMQWFSGKKKIGVTGGASTPMEFVDQVGEYIARQLETPATNA